MSGDFPVVPDQDRPSVTPPGARAAQVAAVQNANNSLAQANALTRRLAGLAARHLTSPVPLELPW